MSANSYIGRSPAFLKAFDRVIRYVPADLLANHGCDAETLIDETREAFVQLIPQLPYIGEQNIWLENLLQAAMNLAMQRTLRKYGYTPAEMDQIVQAFYERVLTSQPKIARSLMHWYSFSPFYRSRLRKAAEISQQRRYPGNWVFSYLPGDDKNYDYGLDISECAICKFYTAQDEAGLVPGLCRLDFVSSQVLNLGLCRNTTLGEGGLKCDFRFRQGAAAECDECEDA